MEAARVATDADLASLAEMCRAALAELGARERGGPVFVAREARAEPVEDSLGAAVADPDQLVMVGTIDEVAVGYATCRVERLRDGRSLGIIDDLYVDEEARSVGVGEAMMDRVLSWCAERGCAGVDSTALPGDRQTKNFFEESGFTARMLVMYHRIEE